MRVGGLWGNERGGGGEGGIKYSSSDYFISCKKQLSLLAAALSHVCSHTPPAVYIFIYVISSLFVCVFFNVAEARSVAAR